ncbi:Pre-mRNA-processing-splicing factor 8-like protein [Frankliniella fusca]|uniref:Pre-mRNA-processing-splicing factor 8-like protein n=1 Tax=Frankliniella fusca TaxID=407009 RepID=A0AAE1HAR4_9NEOP|nr:Pre-mRNA-processing-splicing factor 8-like protein [Frankliniella fusca]
MLPTLIKALKKIIKVFRNKKNKIFQLFSNPVDPYLSGSVFSRLVQWCTPFYEKAVLRKNGPSSRLHCKKHP